MAATTPPKNEPAKGKKTPAKKESGPMGVAWPIWAGAAAVGLFLFFRSRQAAPQTSLVGAQAGGLTPVVGEPPSVAVQPNTLQDWSTAAQSCAVGQGINAVLIEQAIADMIAGATMSQDEKRALNTAFGCAGPPPANFQLAFNPAAAPPPTHPPPKPSSDLTAQQLEGIHILGDETIKSLQTPGVQANPVGVNFLNANQANKLAGLPYYDGTGKLVIPPGTTPGMMI